jgi:hypothetical protein
MADEMQHSHEMTHKYEPDGDSQDMPNGAVTTTVNFEHAHADGATPHHHANSDAPSNAEPEPKPEPDVKPLIPLWVSN